MLTPVPDGSVPAITPTEVLQSLVDHDVDFVVIGGIAALLHGYDRMTADLDTTAARQEDNLDRLAVALTSIGAQFLVDTGNGDLATIDMPVISATFASMASVRFLTDHGVVDIVLRPDGIHDYDHWRDHALTASLPSGATYRYASLEDIILSKEAANRPKDRETVPRLRHLQDLRTGKSKDR